MKDIAFLKKKGCKLDYDFYLILYKKWEQLHGAKKIKMNVTNGEFFTEKITRKFDHDWLHEYFAFNNRPLNEKI